MQLRLALFIAVIAVCSGFNVAIRPAASHALASRAVAPIMVVEHLPAIDAASQLVAAQGLVLPIPAFSPAKVRASRLGHRRTDAPNRSGLAARAGAPAGVAGTQRSRQRPDTKMASANHPSLAHEQAPIQRR